VGERKGRGKGKGRGRVGTHAEKNGGRRIGVIAICAGIRSRPLKGIPTKEKRGKENP